MHTKQFFREHVLNYVGGAWKASAHPEYVTVANPATGDALGSVPSARRKTSTTR